MCVCVFEQEGHIRECVTNKDECFILKGDKVKRVTAGSGIWNVCLCVCARVCVCVSACHSKHTSRWITKAYLYFSHHILLTPFPHHITPISPEHRPPALSTFIFFRLCIFLRSPPSSHSQPDTAVMPESIVLVHLFRCVCSFLCRCEGKVHCCRHQVKQIQKWINFPLQPLLWQSTSPALDLWTANSLSEPLCGQHCCVTAECLC